MDAKKIFEGVCMPMGFFFSELDPSLMNSPSDCSESAFLRGQYELIIVNISSFISAS